MELHTPVIMRDYINGIIYPMSSDIGFFVYLFKAYDKEVTGWKLE